MKLKDQSVEGIKSTGLSTAMIGALGVVQMVVMRRLLAPADFGLMSMVNVVIGLAALFADMGIGGAIIQRREVTREDLSSLYWLNLLVGLFLFLLLCGLTPLIVLFYNEPRLTPLLAWTGLLFVIAAVGAQFQTLLEREMEFTRLAWIETSAAAIGMIIAITMGLKGCGVYSLIAGTLSNAGGKSLILSVVGFKRWRPLFRFQKRRTQGYLAFGLNLVGQRSVNYLTANTDFMLIGSLLGAQALGYYSLAYNLANLPSTRINAVISRVFFPAFSQLQDNLVRLKSGFLRMQEFTSVINIPVVFGMAVAAPVAIPLFFGDRWIPSVLLLQILVIVGFGRAVAGTIGPLLLARGRTDLGFKWSLMLVAIQVPGIFLGISLGGMVGVAIAFAILQSCYLVLNYLILVRKLLGPCLKEYVQRIWPSFWMSLGMAAVSFVISIVLKFLPPLLLLALTTASGVGLYLLLIWHRNKPLFVEIRQLVLQRRIA